MVARGMGRGQSTRTAPGPAPRLWPGLPHTSHLKLGPKRGRQQGWGLGGRGVQALFPCTGTGPSLLPLGDGLLPSAVASHWLATG